MKICAKNTLTKLFGLIFLLTLLANVFAMLTVCAAIAENEQNNMRAVMLNAQEYPQYLNGSYKVAYGIKNTDIDISNCETNGGERGSYSLSNIFDSNKGTFWISEHANTEQSTISVTVRFQSQQPVFGILYGTSYYSRNNGRNFSGYPSTLNVYTATDGEDFRLAGTCVSTPEQDTEFVLFSLPETVRCNTIRLEFADVITFADVFGGADVAAISDLAFFTQPENMDLLTPTMAQNDYGNDNFLLSNSVSGDSIICRANGGGDISNAFDGNARTYWSSVNYNTDIFKNRITAIFNNPVQLESIVYACSYYTAGGRRNYSGFPRVLKVYTSETDDNLSLAAVFAGEPTANWDKARFAFREPITCKRMVLEFTDVTTYAGVADGAPIAVAGELFLVQTANDDLSEISEIFADYAQYELKPEYNSIEKLNALREQAKHSTNYANTYKPILDRADAVCSGAIKKDPHREFSTESGARNRITQFGDMVSYCRGGGLKLPNYGTNQQLTGIGGTTGETIVIYVEADEGVHLPQILFTQIYGAWNSWKATVNLKPGKNVFTFPNIKAHGGYSVDIAAGGPIHILNPYTYESQGGNVKLYIEGGYLYPVFRDGDDEESFRMILTDYYEKLTDPNNTAITVDAFECASNYVICSTRASQAYQQYVVNGVSPQSNIDTWNYWLTSLLSYGGVQLDSTGEFYDPRNEYASVNIRAVQPYAGMFAFAWTDHVGLPDGGMQSHLVNKGIAGWAMGHEVGHMLDIGERRVGETTNNMWAIYDIYMIDGNFNDRINVTNVAANLASDFSPKTGQFYLNGSDNCDIWWILEGGHPGYWGNSENMYRYEPTGKSLGVTERFVYYGSLATGEDLSEYFERWGFYRGDAFTAQNRFSYEKASQEFKDLMTAAKAAGRIKGNGRKFWYVNNDQYRYEYAHGGKLSADWAACYSEADKITISADSIMKSDNGYTFILPEIANAQAHLCYEIQVKMGGEWKVAGITYSTVFTDSHDYNGVVPEYRVYAYDRMLNHTGDSVSVTPHTTEQTAVCRIGETYYDSLKKAVAAAERDAVIYLLKDFHDGSITINKPLTIAVDESIAAESVTITKNTDGHLLNVTGGGFTLKLGGADSTKKIILDGGNFRQSGSLLRTSGSNYSVVRTEARKVIFRNNYSSGNGGGVYVGYCGQIYLFESVVQNNRAVNGGGAYLEGSNPGYGRSQMALFNAIIENNIVSGNGGGIYSSNVNGTNFVVNTTSNPDPEFSKVIIRNNSAVNGGGIYADNIVELRFLTLADNHASGLGGGVYVVRKIVSFVSSVISGNTAADHKSSAVYLDNPERFTLNGGSVAGAISRKTVGVMNIDTALPDLSQAVFHVPAIPAEGLTLFQNILHTTLSQEQVDAITIENGIARLEGGIIKAMRKLADITLSFNGKTEVVQLPWGDFTFPERMDVLPETEYIVSWRTGGVSYSAGDVYCINQSRTFELVTGDYCILTLAYPDSTETHYIVPQGVYHLPMRTPDDKVIFGWEDDANNYYAYADGVTITRSITFTAVVKQQLKVLFNVNGETAEYMYNIGDMVILPMPQAEAGKVFKHWLIDGAKYAAGASVMVNSSISAVAEFTETWRVTTVIDEREETAVYEHNAVIVLPCPQESLGRVFGYWLADGVKYYADVQYVVKKDVEFVAVFVQIDENETITVTFVWNKGTDDSGEIVENETREIQASYFEEVVLPLPEVNEGYVFRYWEVNGNRYNAGDIIKVTEAFTANAVVTAGDTEDEEEFFTVTLVKTENGAEKIYTYRYGKGEGFLLKDPGQAPDGKKFAYWLVGETKYNTGDTVVIGADITITAVYESISLPENPPEENNEPDDNKDPDNNEKPEQPDDSALKEKGSSNTGLIVGIGIGVVVVTGGAVAFVIILLKRKKV